MRRPLALPTFLAALTLWAAPIALISTAASARAAADGPEEQLAAASALFDAKKYAEAAAKLDTFLAAYPTHRQAGPAALALGRCRAELKQWDKAVPAYEKAIATRDAAVVAIAELGLGEAAVNSKQWDKAVGALNLAVKESLKPQQMAAAWYWLGQSNFELQRYGTALDAYDRVTQMQPAPDFADGAWYGAGLAALKQNKLLAARERFRTVVDRYPKSDERPDALLALGKVDSELKRWPEARADFERLLNDTPDAPKETRASAEDGLVTALLEQGDYAAATPRLEALLARLGAADPRRARADLSLGHCRYRQKQYQPALEAYTVASRAADPEVAAQGLYWAGNAALALDRPADAAAQFTALVTRYPKDDLAAKAQLKAGDALAAAKQGDAAAKAYRAVIDRYPQSPQVADAKQALSDLVGSITDPAQLAATLRNAPPAERAAGTVRLARLQLGQKRYADAEAALTGLLKANPPADSAAEAQYLLGVACESQDKAAPAATAYAEAVKLSPSAPWAADAQGRLAWLYLTLKQPEKAEAAANAALASSSPKLDPQAEEQARLALVQAQLGQEKWDAALDGCQKLLQTNPAPDTVAAVLFTQAWVSEKRGRPDEAAPIWEKLAAEHPKSDYAAQALMKLGDARLTAGKYDEARDRYAALLAAFPNGPLATEARFKLGSALYNMDKADEAAAAFDAVAAAKPAGPYTPEGLYWAGVALEKAGKKAEAIERLSKLVADYPTHARVANAKIRLAALKAVGG